MAFLADWPVAEMLPVVGAETPILISWAVGLQAARARSGSRARVRSRMGILVSGERRVPRVERQR